MLFTAAPSVHAQSQTLPAPVAGSVSNVTVFHGKGVVVSVNRPEKSVEIKHEAIPGYMGAMTMPFDVRDTNELNGIEAGDPIAFRLNVTTTEGWVDQIHKTGPRVALPAATPTPVVRNLTPLSEGDLLPAYSFTNEFGQPISTAQFKGQALAIEFLFTRCPFPTFCPLVAANFAQAQEKLEGMTNGPANWHLMTITIDPEHDTPAVLREYAGRYHYDSNRWTFATGTVQNIAEFGSLFGLTFVRDPESGLPNHNLRTVIVDATGRVQDIIIGNDWSGAELTPLVVRAAEKQR